jgi:antitoxin (DNA-binding transcriptional repressor) of toxin-antitoxin stability system
MRLDEMTIHDYNVVMTPVRIADLKARLSAHLKTVRKGRTLTVFDRDTPIAQIVPFAAESVEVRRATRRAKDLKRPPRLSRATDSLALLLEDRGRR